MEFGDFKHHVRLDNFGGILIMWVETAQIEYIEPAKQVDR